MRLRKAQEVLTRPTLAVTASTHLSDEVVVRLRHGDGAEQLLQVIGQLAAAAVALARRVQRHKHASVEVDVDVTAQQGDGGSTLLDGGLDELQRRRAKGPRDVR